jgi:hypothetical protein
VISPNKINQVSYVHWLADSWAGVPGCSIQQIVPRDSGSAAAYGQQPDMRRKKVIKTVLLCTCRRMPAACAHDKFVTTATPFAPVPRLTTDAEEPASNQGDPI